MSKKNFTGGLNSLLGDNNKEEKPIKVGRPKTQFKDITKTSQELKNIQYIVMNIMKKSTLSM